MRYFIFLDQQICGPYEELEISTMMKRGDINMDTLARTSPERPWRPLRELTQVQFARPTPTVPIAHRSIFDHKIAARSVIAVIVISVAWIPVWIWYDDYKLHHPDRSKPRTPKAAASTPAPGAYSLGYDAGQVEGMVAALKGRGIPTELALRVRATQAAKEANVYIDADDWISGFCRGFASGYKATAKKAF